MAHAQVNIQDLNDTLQPNNSGDSEDTVQAKARKAGLDGSGLIMASGATTPPLRVSGGSLTSSLKRAPTNQPRDASIQSAEAQHSDTTVSSSPMPILSSQLPRNAVLGGGQNISFSPLPVGHSFSESHPARRVNDFSSSPARSITHALQNAEAIEAEQGVGRRGGHLSASDHDVIAGDDHWVTHASGATGASAVHFQPQRSHHPHGHRGRVGSGVGSSGWMATSLPESRLSEFEVVYDDGVRRQRTFSLTTEMDDDDDQTSSNDNNSENSPLLEYQEAHFPHYRHQQQYPHDARMHDEYTGLIQGGAGSNQSAHGHSVPFPGKQNIYHPSSAASDGRYHSGPFGSKNPFAYLIAGILAAWQHISEFKLSTPNRRILKASLAYFFGCLVSFTPFFLPYIGTSGHLAATSAVFFNPAKSLGRMVDAVTAGLCAIGFGVLVSVGSMASAVWFNSRDLYVWGHVVSVVVFGGGSTFIVAYAKAYFNRPTVNVGKEGALTLVEFNLTRVLTVTTSILLGVAISTVLSISLWPESAHEKLRQDMGKSLSSFRLLLKLLTKTFLLESDTTPFGSESVQKLIESQVKSFSQLAKSLEEAQLEFPGANIKKYEDCVKSLNTLAQYLNGLRSSCGLQYDMLKKDELRKEGVTQRQAASTPVQGSRAAGKQTMGMGVRMSSYSLIGSLTSDQDQSASADLIDFLDHVGKPMKSLALTCKLTIEHLQGIFNSTDVNSPSSISQFHVRQTGYEGGYIFSDSTYDVGTSRTQQGFLNDTSKKNPGFEHMQFNLAKALDIFESANSRALKRFYSQQHKRRSGFFKRPTGMTKRMSEPTLLDIASGLADAATGAELGTADDVFGEKAPVGEQIFLVYFFVFNLMEFSKELAQLVSCVEVLVDGDEGLPLWIARNRQSWWRRIWFTLTGFPRRLRRKHIERTAFEGFDDPEAGIHSSRSDSNHHPQGSTSHEGSGHQQDNSNSSTGFRRRRHKQRLFPKPNIHNKADTLQTPVPSTFAQQWSTRLWKFLHIFRSFQVKYAVKAAVSAIIMLIPAFVDLTRPFFVQYRGEWALISMLIVMVPTVGGTNIVGVYRIMGTIAGCYIGVAVYLLFPANAIMLPICCFLFALPNFYMVLSSSYPRIGQVTLLAFNLVMIQTYNRQNGDGTVPPDEDDDDDDLPRFRPTTILSNMGSLMGGGVDDPGHGSAVWAIAFHRAVAVSIGVVIGVLVTSYVWPYEARVELRKGLSDLMLNISWLYNRLVSVYSTNLDRVSTVPQEDPKQKDQSKFKEFVRRTTFQERFQTPNEEQQPSVGSDMDIAKMNREFMAIELSLQLQLLRLYALLEETPNEPRLKGKFPVGTYKNMLGSCQNILDRFLSMRLVITKDEWLESARRDFIVPVNKERREMVGNVLLYFYTIASALRLKTPLPPYLPPANSARLRLIQKIRHLPVVQNKAVMTEDNDERYIFYYAYALVMEDVIRELERLGRWSQDLFGVITPATEFEAWFTDDGVAPPTLQPSQNQHFLPSSATREAPRSPYHDVEQPYEHPTIHEYDLQTDGESPPMTAGISAQGQSQSLQQQPVTTSDIKHRHQQHPDETSGSLGSEIPGFSKHYSQESHINGRGTASYFDPQGPFKGVTPVQGLPHIQGSGQRTQSSHSLNFAPGTPLSGANPRSQSRQDSQGSGHSNYRGYGTMSQSVGSGGGGGGESVRSKKSGTQSSQPLSRSESSASGVGIQPPTSSRPERPLTTSISATRLSSEQSNILGQQFVQESAQ
ncbi:hypothetical protein EDD21DRAFT_414035 [Dissophora ornata]|nr:hypothetical protein EDD21DRAFT_414035 [Dissophora ornata]